MGVVRWKLRLAHREGVRPPVRLRRSERVNVPALEPEVLVSPESEQIRLTWIGHSTFLIQHMGRNILTDPIFGNCQPVPYGRFRRISPPGLEFENLPPIHDVLISHSHYDHLDWPTVRALGRDVCYWVPQGLGAWFRKRGLKNFRELKWWDSDAISEELGLICVPAQHGSARSLLDRNSTHWCGWVLKSEERSLYFVGDSGYSPIFKDIGERLGGFDLSIIPIGAYEPRWLMGPVHLDPKEAVMVHRDVHSHMSVACHWGTFRMTDEPWHEPPELLKKELAAQGVDPTTFRTLAIGESIEV